MDPHRVLAKLTEKQRRAWIARHVHRWTLQRIALSMGGTRSSVCDLLRRANKRIGIVPRSIRVKPRVVRAVSLSSVVNY